MISEPYLKMNDYHGFSLTETMQLEIRNVYSLNLSKSRNC